MTLNLNSKEAYKKMTEASDEWSVWQSKEIILDEGRKAMFSKCVLKYKSESKSIAEAEWDIFKRRWFLLTGVKVTVEDPKL